MTKILIAGACGAPSEGVINSLLKSNKKETIIGMGSESTDLVLSNANQVKINVALLNSLYKVKPDLVPFKNDLEIFHASVLRNGIRFKENKTFIPSHETIETFLNKYNWNA
jgi:carbamoyl-phosphate synthase large subunit